MKSCCSLRFKTAGLVVGLFYAVSALFLTITGIQYLIEFLSAEDQPQSSSWLIETTILIVIFGLTGLISSILLVVGTLKKRDNLLIPWLVFGVVLIVGVASLILYYNYILFSTLWHKGRLDYSLIIAIILSFAILAFQIYLWKSIKYLYREIQTKKTEHQSADTLRNFIPLYPTFKNFSTTTDV